jgi:hypothetical protein
VILFGSSNNRRIVQSVGVIRTRAVPDAVCGRGTVLNLVGECKIVALQRL